MTSRPRIDALIFTCSGREHLVSQVIKTLNNAEFRKDLRLVLIIDGPVIVENIPASLCDFVYWSTVRRGYLNSITEAVSEVRSEAFLWFEDDWDLKKINLSAVAEAQTFLRNNEKIVQVRWPNIDQESTAGQKLTDEISSSTVRFSGNPNLCRAAAARMYFNAQALKEATGNRVDVGWEEVVSEMMMKNSDHSAVFFDIEEHGVTHLGYLESTNRYWHYVNNFGESGDNELFRKARPGIENINRVSLWFRLLFASSYLLLCLFFNRRASEIAFRLIQVTKQK